MIAPSASSSPWLAVGFTAAGLAFGWSYFAALQRSIALYASGGTLFRALLWMGARLAAAAVFFVFAVLFGPWPLLSAFLGFLAARQLALRAARRAASPRSAA